MSDQFQEEQKPMAMRVASRLHEFSHEQGKRAAVQTATADIVGAASFLEQTIGPNRTIGILMATIEALGDDGPTTRN